MSTTPAQLRFSARFSALLLTALGLVTPAHAQPTITVQPAAQTALAGTNPYLTVVATGAAPLSYVWKKDGAAVSGGTSAELVLKNATAASSGNYTVTITDAKGSTTSGAAALKIVAPAAAEPPALPTIPETVFNITTYGAKADGVTDNTAAIQNTINAALAAGGGIVKVPAGDKPYLAGPLRVGSNLNLQIDAGATLALLPFDATDATPAYPRTGTHFISGSNVQNFAVTGSGTIDGQGGPWWPAYRANSGLRRPRLISLSGCDRVLVQGITMINSPMFHLAFSGNNVSVVGVTIHAPGTSPNTDALDPGGQHIQIQNCDLSIGDDNVAVKASNTYCHDLTIANCTIGEGHGISVGGQTNRGVDGMVVRDCVFNGTVSGLRLKADATEGGMTQNITYTNLTMTNVQYPIVFYSYYKPVGNPGVTGNNQTTPKKVNDWNANPPNSLSSRTLSGWRNITIDNLTSTGAKAYNILWGLPLADYLIANVTLHNVHLSGGPGFEIYDATNVQITGDSDVGKIIADNALIIARQPADQSVAKGAAASFHADALGGSGTADQPVLKYQWNRNGQPLADGKNISGATTATLTIANAQAADAGQYSVTVSTMLDGFDTASNALAPASLPATATSSAAALAIK